MMPGKVSVTNTSMIPGPKSKNCLKQLRLVECPHVTYGDKDFPIFIDSAKGAVVKDVDGNSYLDMTSFFGVSGLGHAAPQVAQAMRSAIKNGWHAMGDVHPHVLKLKAAQALINFLPQGFDQVHFSNSGSDAVETAMKTAYLFTGKPGVIAFDGAYHGLGYGAMHATHRKHFRHPFEKQSKSFVRFEKFNDLKKIKNLKGIGAILVEPIQGRAGIRPAQKDFLMGLKKICKENGILLIFDEIYTGFCRTGKRFAFEHYNVKPDIICLGKGMANGFPISACVTSKKIMKAWGKSKGEAKHTSTFLGNPLGCAMTLATLQTLKKKIWLTRISHAGALLQKGLESLQGEFPQTIKDVQGQGLMWGMEFKNPKTGPQMMKLCLKMKLIVLPAGDKSQVLTLTPPFIINSKQITQALGVLKKAINRSLS